MRLALVTRCVRPQHDHSRRPHVTADRVAVVPFVPTATAVRFVVLGAARDRAVSVKDERAGAERTPLMVLDARWRARRLVRFMYRRRVSAARDAADPLVPHQGQPRCLVGKRRRSKHMAVC
jgi:hypothetical protein